MGVMCQTFCMLRIKYLIKMGKFGPLFGKHLQGYICPCEEMMSAMISAVMCQEAVVFIL